MNKLLTTMLLLTTTTIANATVNTTLTESEKPLNVRCSYLDKDSEGWATGTLVTLKGKFNTMKDVPEEVVLTYNDVELIIAVSTCELEMK